MPQTVITLYSRQGCHLCDQAKQSIIELQKEFDFNLDEVDIDQNDELTELYGLMIPVVFINGKEAGFGQINKMDISNRLQEKLKS
jgi:glutaredoxin